MHVALVIRTVFFHWARHLDIPFHIVSRALCQWPVILQHIRFLLQHMDHSLHGLQIFGEPLFCTDEYRGSLYSGNKRRTNHCHLKLEAVHLFSA